jgi:hypothetical protein
MTDLTTLPDPVPLGVAGAVCVPRSDYAATQADTEPAVLCDDEQRQSYIAERIERALQSPLTATAAAELAPTVLARFPAEAELLTAFAAKVLQTLRDREPHSVLVVSPDVPPVAVMFLCFNGTHLDALPGRVGEYLPRLLGSAGEAFKRFGQLAAYMELDVYAIDAPSADAPRATLDDVFTIELEFSYLPGAMWGLGDQDTGGLPPVTVLNPDLCGPDDLQVLKKLKA